MKVFRITIFFLLVFCSYPLASDAKVPSARWDSLLDVAYKFSWYPRKDLKDLLSQKSKEYRQSLSEYQELLTQELTAAPTKTPLINPDSFVVGKPWKKYYRLGIAQFCMYLAMGNEVYLENANSVISVLSGKKELPDVAFWYYLFQAYSDSAKKDRDALIASVFRLWQDVILKIEFREILLGSDISKSEFASDLPYLYDNIVHLIITKSIIENKIPDLYPLGVIIMSVKDKLSIENGYKNMVEPVVERMHGLKSDNSNLNFAVAFVEATANQYNFEDEKSEELVTARYNAARTFYELALSWASTRKGRSTILTQYMGFNNYIIRRLIAKDSLLAEKSLSDSLPKEASKLAEDSVALYDQLAKPEVQDGGFVAEGFNKKDDYVEAMHQLWDSTAKLLMRLASYYKTDSALIKTSDKNNLKNPLLKYLSFFQKYTREPLAIVPDNAFFLAAYGANELADLYRQEAEYSTNIKTNDLALAYQLEAIELFPMDIIGILKIAYQTNQEGRHNRYLKYVSPVASRLRDSKIAGTWLDNHSTDYENNIAIVSNVVPDVIDNAYSLLKFLQHSDALGSEGALYNKTVAMTKLMKALRRNHSEERLNDVLSSIAKQDFTDKDKAESKIFKIVLPPDLNASADGMSGIETYYYFPNLKKVLYASPDNTIHQYLREMYFEVPYNKHNYLELMERASIGQALDFRDAP